MRSGLQAAAFAMVAAFVAIVPASADETPKRGGT